MAKRDRRRPRTQRDEKRPSPRVRDGEPRPDAQVATARLMVNPAGFAFAERVDGEGSIFVPRKGLGGAMDGDEVVVSWWPAERGPEGRVRSVVRRGRTRITGVLQRIGKRHVVEPDDPRVLGQASVHDGATAEALGKVVVASVVDYPDPWNDDFAVSIQRMLGEPGRLDTEIEKILVEHGVDPFFPEAVTQQATEVPNRVHPADHVGRADLREVHFMTIDPPDARDFDDAVAVEVLGRDRRTATMRIHVAVADVSHYVREGTAIDTEAALRCFSAYLPDRAVPMLPHELSSGICSLVPHRDRLAMVVTVEVEPSGRLGEPTIRAAVIHSHMRLTYEQVAAEIAGGRKLPAPVRERLVVLREAADRLRRARRRRGAIELDLPEAKVLLDEDDPQRIRGVVSARSDPTVARAYNLIEEFMLAANESVAKVAVRHRLPAVFRVHDRPDDDRLERFVAVAELLGAEPPPLERLGDPKGVQKFLAKHASHPRAKTLNSLLLRAMAQAEYQAANIGHFALASPAYVHFTSPIRRYADLISHRVMKAYLHQIGGEAGAEPFPRMPRLKDVMAASERMSTREREVIGAERDAKAMYAAAFMRDRIGDRFEGTVTGVAGAGVFVTLDDPFVDGMIRRTTMEKARRESFDVDELGVRMFSSKTKQTISLGDRLMVEVVDASIQRRQIDFALIAPLSR